MLDKLAFLVALSRERHFGRAAEACGVTQPTLSAGLKQLETTLGVRLVHRSGRFGGFTQEGERVLAWATRIVTDEAAMRDEVRALREGLSGHLRLSVVPTALPIVARLTTPMRQAHPQVIFTIRSCAAAEVLAAVENLQADAGITYVDSAGLGRVRTLPLYEERYRLLTAAPEFAANQFVAWADLAGTRLSLLTDDMQNRHIIDARLSRAGSKPAPVLESNSMILLMTHVQTGHWSSVMPATIADAWSLPPPVRSIPIHDDQPAPMIGLIYTHRDPLLPLTASLVNVANTIDR